MHKELKYCLGWMGFALLAQEFLLDRMLHHIPTRAFILVVLIGLSAFASGAFFALAVHESTHGQCSKK